MILSFAVKTEGHISNDGVFLFHCLVVLTNDKSWMLPL